MKESQLYGLFREHPIVTTDSRHVPQGSLFFALRGDRFDGNRYARQALEAGCSYAIVDDAQAVEDGDSRYILVDDVLRALQDLANEHRLHFPHPVLQITGTNGKTTTKELTAAVLAKKMDVLFTEGNLNNHIGVPLTLLRLAEHHRIAVIETGANHPGEIAQLAKIVDPDYGLITNVGKAHLEGFGSFEGVIRTKGELYDYLRQKQGGRIFRNLSDPVLERMATGLHTIGYGTADEEASLVTGEAVGSGTYLRLRWRTKHMATWHEVQTHLVGNYNVANALAAACVGTYFGVSPEAIDEALSAYIPTNNRSEMLETERNRLIVDAYNANPTSMNAALQNFATMEGAHKMAILGEMRELGAASREEHQRIVDLLRSMDDLESAWLVGEAFCSLFENHTPAPFRLFHNVEEVKGALTESPIEDSLILIKGSNGTRLFQIPTLL